MLAMGILRGGKDMSGGGRAAATYGGDVPTAAPHREGFDGSGRQGGPGEAMRHEDSDIPTVAPPGGAQHEGKRRFARLQRPGEP